MTRVTHGPAPRDECRNCRWRRDTLAPWFCGDCWRMAFIASIADAGLAAVGWLIGRLLGWI